MNENIDLTQILKDCPEGAKFYSMIEGEVEFAEIGNGSGLIYFTDHRVVSLAYHKTGRVHKDRGECVLFPSKEQRDWSKFVPTWETKKEVVKVTLHPFDKVLAKCEGDGKWEATLITDFDNTDVEMPYLGLRYWYGYCIPYNKETAHLIGTTDDCPIDYEIEFSKEFKEK